MHYIFSRFCPNHDHHIAHDGNFKAEGGQFVTDFGQTPEDGHLNSWSICGCWWPIQGRCWPLLVRVASRITLIYYSIYRRDPSPPFGKTLPPSTPDTFRRRTKNTRIRPPSTPDIARRSVNMPASMYMSKSKFVVRSVSGRSLKRFRVSKK